MNSRLKYFIYSSLIISSISNLSYAEDISANTARMQAMDKITGRVSEIDVPVNGITNFGSFSILVRKCVTKSPEETPENTAFVDVVDNYKTDNPVNIFKGWMFSSTPALNAVEHPIYDVWLLKCYNTTQNRGQILSDEQLALRDTIPMKPRKEVLKMQTLQAEDTVASLPENPAEVPVETAAVDYEEDDFIAEDELPLAPDSIQIQAITEATVELPDTINE